MNIIKHLPRTVHTSLQSSVYLLDLPKVVEELILNSVDACSTMIHVFLNAAGSYVKIDDNGIGITREGLEHLGEVRDEDAVYIGRSDYRGETLGSLSDISLVEVITKARGWPNSYHKMLKGGNCLFLGISDARQDVGTTVIVQDLFYNQPVRQKYLQCSSKKVVHSVKKCIVRIALVHPQISFKLTDIENNTLLLSTVSCASPLPLIADAFGNDISDTLLEISASDGVYRLSGYLSRPSDIPSAMAFQLLYINSRFVSKGSIQKLIRDLASDHQRLVRHPKSDTRFYNCKKNKTQGHASYMLNLFCPVSACNLIFEPSRTLAEFKDWPHVLLFIEQAIIHFWKQHAPQISQDELKSSDLGNKETQLQSPYHSYPPSELFSLESSSKSFGATPKERSSEYLKKIAGSKTCQCTSGCHHEHDPIWECQSAVDEGLKETLTMHVMDNVFDDYHANVSLSFSYGDGLVTPHQSSREKNSKACGARLDDFLVFGTSNSTDDIIGEGASLYFSPSISCQDQTAQIENPFLLKRCRRKLDFLSGGDLETDEGIPKKVKMSQSHPRVLLKESSSNYGYELVDSKLYFESPTFPVKCMPTSIRSLDKYESDDITDDFGFTQDGDFEHFLQGSGFCSKMYHPFSKYGDDKFRERNKCTPFEILFEEFDSVDFSSGADSVHIESEDINNRDHVPCLIRRRSHSAPPFYRRKNRFSLPFNRPETLDPCENFLHSYPSMKTPTKQNFNEYSQHPERNRDDEMLQVCKQNSRSNQKSSNVDDPNFRNSAVYCATDEINLQDNTAKWQDDCSGLCMDKQVDGGLEFAGGSNDVLNISSGFLSLACSFLQPESISRDSLQDAEVLLQLDRKFIPIVADGVLAVIDQHAADERIRLEELRKKVLSGGGIGVTYLESEQELVLPEIMYELLQNYSEQIKKWGWEYGVHNPSSNSFSKNSHVLKRRPPTVTLNAFPCILGTNLTDKDLIEFLEQLAETDGSAVIPPSVNRLLNSKACRGAIMFGDTLLPSECSLLVEELKKTSLCFQCAHGRPTAAPLVNIVGLRKQLSSLQLQTKEQADCWHGLKRHMPCLERAQQRLSAAMSFYDQ